MLLISRWMLLYYCFVFGLSCDLVFGFLVLNSVWLVFMVFSSSLIVFFVYRQVLKESWCNLFRQCMLWFCVFVGKNWLIWQGIVLFLWVMMIFSLGKLVKICELSRFYMVIVFFWMKWSEQGLWVGGWYLVVWMMVGMLSLMSVLQSGYQQWLLRVGGICSFLCGLGFSVVLMKLSLVMVCCSFFVYFVIGMLGFCGSLVMFLNCFGKSFVEWWMMLLIFLVKVCMILNGCLECIIWYGCGEISCRLIFVLLMCLRWLRLLKLLLGLIQVLWICLLFSFGF